MEGTIEKKLHEAIDRLDPEYRSDAERHVAALRQAGIQTFDDLLALVQDVSANVDLRATACWVLADLGYKRATPALLRAFQDKETVLRWMAAKALVQLRSKRSVPPLIRTLLTAEDPEIRSAAAWTLGFIGDDRALGPLTETAQRIGDDIEVRSHALEALGHLMHTGAVSALVPCLSDESASVRFWAAFALGNVGGDDVVPELQKLADADHAVVPGWWAVSKEAADAIERIRKGLSFGTLHP
jgi:HEAT repeat protein